MINKIKPYAIRVPKIKTIEDVKLACDLIDDGIEVHLSIETKEAFENLSKLKLNNNVMIGYFNKILKFHPLSAVTTNILHYR